MSNNIFKPYLYKCCKLLFIDIVWRGTKTCENKIKILQNKMC